MERSAGILLPIFSLPGSYGAGVLGREAREFVDFLHDAGQRWWQILPIGPTGAHCPDKKVCNVQMNFFLLKCKKQEGF